MPIKFSPSSLHFTIFSRYLNNLLRHYAGSRQHQKLAGRSSSWLLGRRSSPSLCMSPLEQSVMVAAPILSNAILNGRYYHRSAGHHFASFDADSEHLHCTRAGSLVSTSSASWPLLRVVLWQCLPRASGLRVKNVLSLLMMLLMDRFPRVVRG